MTRISSVSALALVAMTTPALADVTPQQVWDDLDAYLTSFGYEVSATETAQGDALVISDLRMSMQVEDEISDEPITFSMTMPDMTFADNGAGGVTLTLPESAPFQMVILGGTDDEAIVDMTMTTAGLSTEITGDADDMRYSFAADSMGVRLDQITEGGTALPAEAVQAEVTMGPLSGTAETTLADGLRHITQDLSYGDVTYDMAYAGPPEEADTNGMLKGVLRGLTAKGTSAMPQDVSMEDPLVALQAGMVIDGGLTHAGGEMEFSFQDGMDMVSGRSSSTGGEFALTMTEDKMVYAIKSLGQKLSMMVPDMPFPIEGEMAEASMSFELPLMASETPKPAKIAFLLEEFQMADLIWSLFDPSQVLPRDPATIGATVEAQVTPFVSLLDEEAMTAVERGETLPGELNAVVLKDLVVRAIGAEILGQGDFTFDNSDMQSFGGFPAPEGALDVQLSGINGVIDKLIQMGFVQEQDAMGARMMLGMFTVPGSAPDTATSKIEVNDQGHVLANGQRIK